MKSKNYAKLENICGIGRVIGSGIHTGIYKITNLTN